MSKKLFQRNLGRTDRIIRFIIGVLALGAWYFGAVAGTIAVVIGVAAIMLIGTSAAASCPLNSVANINTMSQKEREKHDAKGISYQKNVREAMGQEKKFILGKILGVLFILSAIPKAIGLQMAVDNFNKWLLGDEWRYLVALVEIVAGLLMFSKWERYGTIILLGIMPAATLVHIQFQEWVMLPMPIIFGLLLLYYDKKSVRYKLINSAIPKLETT